MPYAALLGNLDWLCVGCAGSYSLHRLMVEACFDSDHRGSPAAECNLVSFLYRIIGCVLMNIQVFCEALPGYL